MARDLHQLRNIGIIAHIDAGKTTLTERMLYYAGATHRMGEVDKGTTKTDYDEEEQQRGITIYAACITFQWRDVTINLIDTPGHVDFTAEVERSLRVLDGGVVVFSAREGVEAQSETVWRQADKYHVPRIAFINKMDREGADFAGTLREIRERLQANPVPVNLPVGAGPPHLPDAFRGLIDLVTMKLVTFTAEKQGARVVVDELPAELVDDARQGRHEMLESLYDYSNELMELALEDAPVPEKLLRKVIREATLHHLITPVFCGSALDFIGVQPILDGVADYLPSPADMPPVTGTNPRQRDKPETRQPALDEPFCGLVFKVEAERTGDFSYVRVYSGRLSANTRIYNPGKDKKDNAAQLWQIKPGGKGQQVQQVEAGDIVGVIGLRHSVTGDTVCDYQHPILLESIKFPETVISMAIEPETSTERKKLADTLELMKRQDPTFMAQENEETGQTLISGMGELHLEVIKHRLLRDFKLDVKVHHPRVSYRETIEKATDAVGKCQRQIAGTGTFARIEIHMQPADNPASQVTLGPGVSLPAAYLQAALEELTARSQGGGYYGFPLTRVRITLTGGEAREGESNEVAFRIAANDAFDRGLEQAGVVLMEPIMRLQISTPEENLGDIISSLQQKRAVIHATHPRGRDTVIDAEAPLAQLFGFAGELRSLSQGRASCSMEPSAYGPAPPEVLASLV
ncbi:MAG: elongation factor G [Planctomycetales bacterium]|nr:elongation factor G [Planctomycetales bacterium]NIP85030.1 elongation factor G [Planctomycetales bacterium]